ncbi:MAG TPA: PDZ domain-containing protein [Pyrinomonadaceae bacterium]|nr:PDZ domain-containing protein [Pyrinomonadaceae bacterium]
MPSELRFCRNCGFRLGEGSAENTETIRFGGTNAGAVSAPVPAKKRRRMSGMAWIFLGLLIFFIGAAAFTAVISPVRDHVGNRVNLPDKKSYIGVDGWEQINKTVTFKQINLPGGPADKAGLVGGDVIVSFDGQRINDDDQIRDLMVRTPVGKTVDVEYMRDGETRKTSLTTISEDEFQRIRDAFEDRPEGRGQFGYEPGHAKRVEIPGTKMFGVQLGDISQSRPADMAGVKPGDIVVEFDGVPIRTPDEFRMRVRRAIPYNTIKLVVMREGQKVEIPVKMGRQ